jgi:hypothetical protein
MIQILAVTCALFTSFSVAYLYKLYRDLSKQVQHRSHCGNASALCGKPVHIATVPESVYSGRYFAQYDMSSKSVCRSDLQADQIGPLLTKLVRRNMTASMHFPQALMFQSASSTIEERQSFETSHITSLFFGEGDLVCGVYRVIRRSQSTVEFEIQMKSMEFLDGRLAIFFCEQGNDIVFCSKTIIWRPCQEPRAMPLEKPLLRWMHETSAWWLLDTGVKYLSNLDS